MYNYLLCEQFVLVREALLPWLIQQDMELV